MPQKAKAIICARGIARREHQRMLANNVRGGLPSWVTTAYRGGRAARTGQSAMRERVRCQGGARL
eukprot:10301253-Alexandrium_andersonii.AAC.1